MITYNDILNRMKNAYFEKTGENVDTVSDLGARFQAVASELYSLSCHADFVLKQAFVQTATGDYLDRHAALRDITRKSAAKAYGSLTFSVTEQALTDITVPAHTVCSVNGKPYIQFETTQDAVIAAGATTVSVPAAATENGSVYNAAAGTVTVMVNPPTGVESVSNEAAFDGGADTETDAKLRRRILDSYRIPQSGFSVLSLREAVMKLSDVLDAAVTFDGSSICATVITKTPTLSDALTAQIEDCMSISDVTEAEVTVRRAAKQSPSFVVSAELVGGDEETVRTQLEERLREFVGNLRIGESLNLRRAETALLQTEGIQHCTVQAVGHTGDIFNCPDGGYLRAERITVNCYVV